MASKNIRSRLIVVEFPVLGNYMIHVEVYPNLKKLFKKYKATKGLWEKEDKRGEAFTINRSESHMSFIFLKPNVSNGTIAHESWHAIQNLFECVGAELENEMVAYHLGFLVDQICKLMRRK